MINKKILFHFRTNQAGKPIVYHLIKNFNLTVSILRAQITPDAEGYLVLDISGQENDINRGIEFVKKSGVNVDTVKKDIRWDEKKCTHCGNCLPHCPTQALDIKDRKTMLVSFNDSLCIECLACIKNCPFGACRSAF